MIPRICQNFPVRKVSLFSLLFWCEDAVRTRQALRGTSDMVLINKPCRKHRQGCTAPVLTANDISALHDHHQCLCSVVRIIELLINRKTLKVSG